MKNDPVFFFNFQFQILQFHHLGQISLTSDEEKYYVLSGEDLEIIWKIVGIKASTLDSREWSFVTVNKVLAVIKNDDDAVTNNKTILAEGFEVRKPLTLYLKKVDQRYNGKYRLIIKKGFDTYQSDVTVFVLSKCVSVCIVYYPIIAIPFYVS